jgi:transposase
MRANRANTTLTREIELGQKAIGRNNWIHVGSPQEGPKIAAILSVVESCRRLKLPVRDYLAAVLPGLADLPIQRLPGLIPAALQRLGL